MEQNDALQKQISATILQLRVRSPFFATLALFARIHFTDAVPAAGTDGRDIYLNQQFWQELTPPQRLGLLAHEVLHAALLHTVRRGHRDLLLWNIAADIVVNGIVLAQPNFELPAGAISNPSLEHLSVEEIYHILQQSGQQPALQIVDLKDASVNPQNVVELEAHWREAMQHAQTLARMQGHGVLPVGLQRELPHLNSAQLDWRSYLWRFLVQTPTDFQGYDRRFIGQRLYLETLTGESVRVYVAVDTSGSIDEEEIAQFLGEVIGILRAYPHLEASLYYVDTECHGPYPLLTQDELPVPVGGGGTDFRPFFAAVEAEQSDMHPAVCVYLTDGYGTFPAEPPPWPLLWVLSPGSLSTDAVPFGEAVRLIPG
ncbi:hydrolase [Reticulibacter mediterranei]|uniref:Hydrolase n=1 Tax=Reticulibacter mediterranei TaxID=2778369 RepID=A0A8J3IYV5_9CHLR|nr:VWA-like domain-containing protein [Reticulibacter mediterranei]GHP01039.1 hydrolase [Reticulibacter mediterranei]